MKKSKQTRTPKNSRPDNHDENSREIEKAATAPPIQNGWQPLVESLSMFTDDFMDEREQPHLGDATTNKL